MQIDDNGNLLKYNNLVNVQYSYSGIETILEFY